MSALPSASPNILCVIVIHSWACSVHRSSWARASAVGSESIFVVRSRNALPTFCGSAMPRSGNSGARVRKSRTSRWLRSATRARLCESCTGSGKLTSGFSGAGTTEPLAEAPPQQRRDDHSPIQRATAPTGAFPAESRAFLPARSATRAFLGRAFYLRAGRRAACGARYSITSSARARRPVSGDRTFQSLKRATTAPVHAHYFREVPPSRELHLHS